MLLVSVLYFALLGVSLFDCMVLLWLALAVVLNAERRSWSLVIAGCGLAAGAAFFVGHAAVIMQSATTVGPELNAWWPTSWAALVFSPFAWYLAMLWHTGYWEERHSALRRRQRWWLVAAVTLAAGLAGLLIITRPLPFSIHGAGLDISAAPAFRGIPLLVLLYPLFAFLCTGMSLEALVHPGPAHRAMGELARRRARPWLVGASLALLAVSVVVMDLMLWLVLSGGHGLLRALTLGQALNLLWLDLAASLLVTAAVVLVGQAVVAYEIFTGKTLPRQGLRRQWRQCLVAAAAFGAAISLAFVLELPYPYLILLAAVLVAGTHALFSWGAFVDREQSLAAVRPFLASQHLYDALVATTTGAEAAGVPLAALCDEVLGARSACLAPLGAFSSLLPGVICHPAGQAAPAETAELARRCTGPGQPWALPAAAGWAVPLWGRGGLMGLLYLGAKTDGGLYSQEDIEIARAAGERLVDMAAAAHLAQRLMLLQRERAVEQQVLGQQARRALHDEVLPALHAAMLALGGAEPAAVAQLGEVHGRISALLRDMPAARASPVAELGLVGALRAFVEGEMAGEFEEVSWQIGPAAEKQAAGLAELPAGVAYYAVAEVVRNAARHGRGGQARPLRLTIAAEAGEGLTLMIGDDGVGPAGGGSGQGLALHGTMLAVIGGSLAIAPAEGGGTVVTVVAPG